MAPRRARRMVRVTARRVGAPVSVVALGAESVSCRARERVELRARVLDVRIVATRAGESVGAAAQHEVAGLARGDVTAAGVRDPVPTFPGVGVAGEQDGVALGAG